MPLTPTDPTKPQVWITGQAPNQTLDFYIPQGPKGDPGGFTFGTLLSVDTNLNQILSSGIYRQPSTPNGTTNYPITAAGILTVMERLNDQTYYSVIQEYYPVNTVMGSGISYRRYYHSNSTWTPWRMFTSTRVDQTAGRAIYQWDDVNNREQLVYGDTGMRDVSSLLVQGTGTVYLRRNTYQVELVLNSYNRPTTDPGGQYTIMTLPAGFKPQTGLPTHPLFQSNGAIALLDVSGASGIVKPLAHPASGNWYGRLTWMTNDAWPTTLPGTASGGIINN